VLGNFSRDFGLGLILELEIGAFLLVVDSRLDLTLGLQGGDDVLVLPSNLVGETAQNAEFAVRLEPKYSQSGGNDVSLPLVIRSGNSLVGAISLHGVLSTGQFVRQHPADGAVKDAAWGSMMEGSPLGVDQATLAKVVHVFQLVPVETSGNVNTFASNDDDSLPLKERLGDDGRQSAQQMPSSVDHQRLRGKTHPSRLAKKDFYF